MARVRAAARSAAVGLGFVGTILAGTLTTGWAAAAEGTGPQHREWIAKHITPGYTLDAKAREAARVPLPTRSVGTPPQHRDWARKFETPGGSLDGRPSQPPVRRSEADVRRLLRCGIMDGMPEPAPVPLVGC